MTRITIEHQAVLDKLFAANFPPGLTAPQITFTGKEIALLIEALVAKGAGAIALEHTSNVLGWITNVSRNHFVADKEQDDALDALIETLREREID